MQVSDRIGRRMKLHDLHVLMAVVQAGSMNKAAVLLNTGQSAISRSIAELEHTIGVLLFDRNPQGVEPTQYGRALLDGGVAVGGLGQRLRQCLDRLRRSGRELRFRRRRSALSALSAHCVSYRDWTCGDPAPGTERT